MFYLSEFKDIVRIPPELFQMPFKDAISDEINRKLANKVVLNVGLCIALYDIKSVKDSYILPGDGASHTEVHFRYVVFRPFINELITGKIKCCSREGVQVTLGFFDDIHIPTTALQFPSRFDEIEQAWVWEYDLGDGNKHDLFMDVGEKVKFRVTSELFQESSPDHCPPSLLAVPAPAPELKAAYKITASISESGLGLLTWWDQK